MKQKLERSRVNLRVPDDLLVWAQAYAFSTNRTLTQLIVDLLFNAQARIAEVDKKIEQGEFKDGRIKRQ
jgi:hypothetical protein